MNKKETVTKSTTTLSPGILLLKCTSAFYKKLFNCHIMVFSKIHRYKVYQYNISWTPITYLHPTLSLRLSILRLSILRLFNCHIMILRKMNRYKMYHYNISWTTITYLQLSFLIKTFQYSGFSIAIWWYSEKYIGTNRTNTIFPELILLFFYLAQDAMVLRSIDDILTNRINKFSSFFLLRPIIFRPDKRVIKHLYCM